MDVNDINVEQVLGSLEKLPAPGRYGVLAAIAVAVVGLYWFALHGAMVEELEIVESELNQVENQIAEARAVAANLKVFREQRQVLRAQLEAALERLPNSKELPVLLTDISSLGKKSGLEVRAFRPRPESSRGFYAEVPIELELFGSYHEVGIFLDRLSRLSRIVNVTRLVLERQPGHQEPPMLRISGVATTFRFVDENPEGGV